MNEFENIEPARMYANFHKHSLQVEYFFLKNSAFGIFTSRTQWTNTQNFHSVARNIHVGFHQTSNSYSPM